MNFYAFVLIDTNKFYPRMVYQSTAPFV